MRLVRSSTYAIWLAVAAWGLVSSVKASADVIRLENGASIRGTITRETRSGIIVRVGRNQEIHISYGEIVEIQRDGESVPIGAGEKPSGRATRNPKREQELIRTYSQSLERAYRKLHPDVVRIPFAVRKEQCDPVRAAKRYGLPVAQANSTKALENIFRLTLECYSSGSTASWRRTLLYYGKPRDTYIAAVSEDVELATIYLDHPDLPYLLGLTND